MLKDALILCCWEVQPFSSGTDLSTDGNKEKTWIWCIQASVDLNFLYVTLYSTASLSFLFQSDIFLELLQCNYTIENVWWAINSTCHLK